MAKTYLLAALRNLFSNKLFSAINLAGLSIGLACVIMISLFVIDETSYDQHWKKADRIYRVMRTFTAPGSPDLHLATNAPQAGRLLKQDFPQFEHVVRILDTTAIISRPGSINSYSETGVYYVDADIHEVFDIPMLHGQWDGALTAPFTIVLSESMATKYFGDANPVGETLLTNNDLPYAITGVMADLNQNSHMSPNAFVSMATLEERFGSAYMNNWGGNDYHTYVVTEESYDIQQFVDEAPAFIQRHVGEANGPNPTYFSVIPVQDIHLNSHRENELDQNGNMILVFAFGGIAILILVIACFNFMNLSTTRSIARAEEIGMRKVFGATRKQLIVQFLSESVLLTIVAIFMAVGISSLMLSWVNNMLGSDLELGMAEHSLYFLYLILLALGVGLLAGSYPAFYMADIPLVKALKGELDTGVKGELLRKSLVVVQFTISVVLIIASSIAFTQIRFMLTMDLGLNKENIVVYSGIGTAGRGRQYQTMKQELLQHPDILSVTAANLMPSNQNTNSSYIRSDGAESELRIMTPLEVDYDFFQTFDIRFVSGRDFSPTNASDMHIRPSEENPHTSGAFILNESAVKQFGWTPENAIGRSFEDLYTADAAMSVRGAVIGVTEDILFSSVREQVKPTFYRLRGNSNTQSSSSGFRQMAVKYSGNNLRETMTYIEAVWHRFMPGVPISQSFLNQNYAGLYQAEQRQGNVFTLFSVIAIFIAVLGLFGLASYLTERRTKEIGVRKVLGSTVLGIVILLSGDFCKLVVAANFIAWPIAWYMMNAWKQGFVYQAEIGPGIFVAAAAATLTIAFLTVGSLAALTALQNPIYALRHQ